MKILLKIIRPIIILFLGSSVFSPLSLAADDIIAITPSIQSRLVKDDLKHFLVVEGTTTLPEQSILKSNLFYILSAQTEFTEETEKSAKFIDSRKCWVKNGLYVIEFGPYSQQPPPGNYPISVSFNPLRQIAEVQEKTDIDVEIVKRTVLQVGTYDDAIRERNQTLAALKKQASRVPPLFTEVKSFFLSVDKTKPLTDTLKSWRPDITRRIDEIAAVAIKPDEIRVFELVTMNRSLLESLTAALKYLVDNLSEKALANPDDSAIRKELDLFEKRLEQDLAYLGVAKSFNKDTIAGIIKEIEAGIEKKEQDKITLLLLQLSKELPEENYELVNRLAGDILEFFKSRSDDLKEIILNDIAELKKLLSE